jgi:hypothetical protein
MCLVQQYFYVFNAAVSCINTVIYVLNTAIAAYAIPRVLNQAVGYTDIILYVFDPAVSGINTVCCQALCCP